MGGLGQISLVSLSHSKPHQGDRKTCQPSHHDMLNWNKAEIGDPSANSSVIQLEQVSGQGKRLWSPQPLQGFLHPRKSGVHLLPPNGKDTRPTNQDGSAQHTNVPFTLPPCTTRTTKGRRTCTDSSSKHKKE